MGLTVGEAVACLQSHQVTIGSALQLQLCLACHALTPRVLHTAKMLTPAYLLPSQLLLIMRSVAAR